MTAILNGIDEGTNEADVPTTTDPGITLPVDVEIPGSADEAIGLLDQRTGDLARLSSAEWAAQFGLASSEAQSFLAIDTTEKGPLGLALKDIREDFAFETGQAQDVFELGTDAAKQKFGVGARGLRMGLLGVAQSITGQAASSGFAKSGQTQRQRETASRAGGQGLSDLFGQKSLRLEGADITRQSALFGAGQGAQSALRGILSTVAGRVADMTALAAQIRAAGGVADPDKPGGQGGGGAIPDVLTPKPTVDGTSNGDTSPVPSWIWTDPPGEWRIKLGGPDT